jgi:hypothetical protein
MTLRFAKDLEAFGHGCKDLATEDRRTQRRSCDAPPIVTRQYLTPSSRTTEDAEGTEEMHFNEMRWVVDSAMKVTAGPELGGRLQKHRP